MKESGQGDLYVLVADQDMRQSISKLLARPESLQIRPIKYTVERHMQRDPGCRAHAAGRLRPFISKYRHAMVVFDKEGSGQEHESRRQIQHDVERDLSRNGWNNRAKAIVIEPELETWVWNGSNDVPRILGWDSNYTSLRTWLTDKGLFPPDTAKPPDPKTAMKAALQEKRRLLSAALFGELAMTVSLRRCQCPAFRELRTTLQRWFPPRVARSPTTTEER